MEPQEVTYNEVVNYVSGEILGGPEDDIWDNIFDWIQNAISSITHVVVQWINSAVSWITYNVRSIVSTAIASVTSIITTIRSKLDSVWSEVLSIYSKVSLWLTTAYSTVYSAATSAISVVRSWLSDTVSNIISWVTTQATTIKTWITTTFNNLSITIKTWFTGLWADVSGLFSSWGKTIGEWWKATIAIINSYFTDLWTKLTATWTWLTTWMTENIVKPLDTWWDNFLLKVFDFGSWVGKLFDAISAWVTRDVPGSSPWWEGVLNKIYEFFFHKPPAGWTPWRWALEVIMYTILQIVTGGLYGEYFSSPAKAAKTVARVFYPLAEVFTSIFDEFMKTLVDSASSMGPVTPDSAHLVQAQLNKVGTTVFAGLAAMSIAGELTVVGSKIGLGHISAMIYDLTNFKVLTGAFVTALAIAAVRTPLTYYYNNLFRPQLPKEKQVDELYSRDLIPYAKYSELLGYQGLPDVWHEKYADMAYRPASLYTLSSLATTGVFDEKLFMDNLRDWGLRPDMRALFIAMYKAKATETVKGLMSGVAMTRFKEGYTTESQFTSELRLLRYTDEEIPIYLAASQLSYATDYLSDMKTAYTDAVRKGFISLDEYRQDLLGLGIVPERVESFVIRQRTYLKPKEKPTPVSPPTPYYETEGGKVQVDTLRRQRRKNIIIRDEEIAGLLELGMEVDYATAIANNDDVRLAEKSTE